MVLINLVRNMYILTLALGESVFLILVRFMHSFSLVQAGYIPPLPFVNQVIFLRPNQAKLDP